MTLVTVTCSHSTANWGKPPKDGSLTDFVDIWRIPVNPDLQFLNRMESLLLPDEVRKALRFRQQKDKHRFIIRRAALRIILSGYLGVPEKDIQFIAGVNKKPFVEKISEIDLHYNVSHSGEWILIAVANSGIGVDLEQTDTGFDYRILLDESFSKEEADYLRNEQHPERSFFRLWTRKEALTKATSKGLDDDFANIPSLDGNHQRSSSLMESEANWIVNSFEVTDGYTGSIAYSPELKPQFLDFAIN